MSVITTTPVKYIERPAACDWLAEHGFDARDVASASIRIDHHHRDGIGVWLDVDWYLRNAAGQLYVDSQDGNRIASASATVPLIRWPPLVQVEIEPDGG